jgi:2-phosphoglycolate phosphatase
VNAYSAVVYDLDGTLIDSHRDIANALNHVLASLGRPTHSPDAVRKMIGHGVESLLVSALGERNESHLREARASFKDAYGARLLETTVLFDGIPKALRSIHEHGALQVIATNKPSFFTRTIVEALGLESLGVLAAACADEAGARKPSPRVIELALERAAQIAQRPLPARSETLYVGDMPVDVEAGRAFGCSVLGVAWGFDPDGMRGADPDGWVESPRALAAFAIGSAREL